MNLEGQVDRLEETLVQVNVVNILVKKAYSAFDIHHSRVRAAQAALLKILELDDSSIFEKARLAMLNTAQETSMAVAESPFTRRASHVLDPPQASPYSRARRSIGAASSVLDRRMSRGRAILQPPFSIRNTSNTDQNPSTDRDVSTRFVLVRALRRILNSRLPTLFILIFVLLLQLIIFNILSVLIDKSTSVVCLYINLQDSSML